MGPDPYVLDKLKEKLDKASDEFNKAVKEEIEATKALREATQMWSVVTAEVAMLKMTPCNERRNRALDAVSTAKAALKDAEFRMARQRAGMELGGALRDPSHPLHDELLLQLKPGSEQEAFLKYCLGEGPVRVGGAACCRCVCQLMFAVEFVHRCSMCQ